MRVTIQKSKRIISLLVGVGAVLCSVLSTNSLYGFSNTSQSEAPQKSSYMYLRHNYSNRAMMRTLGELAEMYNAFMLLKDLDRIGVDPTNAYECMAELITISMSVRCDLYLLFEDISLEALTLEDIKEKISEGSDEEITLEKIQDTYRAIFLLAYSNPIETSLRKDIDKIKDEHKTSKFRELETELRMSKQRTKSIYFKCSKDIQAEISQIVSNNPSNYDLELYITDPVGCYYQIDENAILETETTLLLLCYLIHTRPEKYRRFEKKMKMDYGPMFISAFHKLMDIIFQTLEDVRIQYFKPGGDSIDINVIDPTPLLYYQMEVLTVFIHSLISAYLYKDKDLKVAIKRDCDVLERFMDVSNFKYWTSDKVKFPNISVEEDFNTYFNTIIDWLMTHEMFVNPPLP
ncbi:hypothetical protein NEOKW01_0510 [Nematocida sp. AWRm80]|nr:hypothetical protein NEOKW01_0510 [Nematocida sp. AWRm80]